MLAPTPTPIRVRLVSLIGDLERRTELVFRLVVIAQTATVLLTWQLWNDRSTPPVLPAVDWLPALSMGIPMLISLAGAAYRPKSGTFLHITVLAYAVLLDQTRLQPEVVSLALLMAAIAVPALRVLGRAHLVTLWIWAGVHKLLSPGFADGAAVFLAGGLGIHPSLVQWLGPLAEIAVGVLAIGRRTRRAAVVLAFGVHGSILVSLVAQRWNVAVWPWNLALPFAAAFLLAEDLTIGDSGHGRRGTAVLMNAVVWLVFSVYPAAFYLGRSDAYLAHNLYTDNVQAAVVCPVAEPADCTDPFRTTWDELNVPLPPERRLFRGWFEQTCQPGDVLVVFPIRTRLTDFPSRRYTCGVGGTA
jgi:uncharacterized membrane protein YphA (DoxX/SURF4 family)